MRLAMKRAGVCLLLAASLAGCGYKDGQYTAQFESFDSLGYKDSLTVTVQDGVITQARFDATNVQGGLKSEDTLYARRMLPLCGTDPAQISSYFSDALTGLSSPDDLQVDAVSGATVSSRRFQSLWEALQSPMKKGETEPLILTDLPEFSPAASSSE